MYLFYVHISHIIQTGPHGVWLSLTEKGAVILYAIGLDVLTVTNAGKQFFGPLRENWFYHTMLAFLCIRKSLLGR